MLQSILPSNVTDKSVDVSEEHSDEGGLEAPVWVALSGIFWPF